MNVADIRLMILILIALQQLFMKDLMVSHGLTYSIYSIFLRAHAANNEPYRTLCSEIYHCYILDDLIFIIIFKVL